MDTPCLGQAISIKWNTLQTYLQAVMSILQKGLFHELEDYDRQRKTIGSELLLLASALIFGHLDKKWILDNVMLQTAASIWNQYRTSGEKLMYEEYFEAVLKHTAELQITSPNIPFTSWRKSDLNLADMLTNWVPLTHELQKVQASMEKIKSTKLDDNTLATLKQRLCQVIENILRNTNTYFANRSIRKIKAH